MARWLYELRPTSSRLQKPETATSSAFILHPSSFLRAFLSSVFSKSQKGRGFAVHRSSNGRKQRALLQYEGELGWIRHRYALRYGQRIPADALHGVFSLTRCGPETVNVETNCSNRQLIRTWSIKGYSLRQRARRIPWCLTGASSRFS